MENMEEYSPAAILTATLSVRTLGLGSKPTRTIRRLSQLFRIRRGHSPLLKSQHPRLARILPLASLQLLHLTTQRVLLTTRILLRREPLGIVRHPQVELLSRQPDLLVRLDGVVRVRHAAVVLGHVVAPVDQVVGHHVDHVDGLCDLGAVFLGVGDHVAALAWGCDGEELVLG